mmetsp:Transcript_17478/g.29419  ORF Transcript_17478/g.29419 Transcript_17478/m.29419 type:complete len:132 (+) Transcript_17478:269-664(+)
MVGFENEDLSFVFELTFNYGINHYRRGNDLLSLNLHRFNKDGENMEKKLLEHFEGASGCLRNLEAEGLGKDLPINQELKNPTYYNFINGDFLLSFSDSTATSSQLVSGLTLNCADLELNYRFWQKIGLLKK